jgi:hypothetical protein
MLISVCSSKGAPGVTSTALALAAVWPRPVVLLEADVSGGDLAFRCRSASGGPLSATPNLLGVAAAVGGTSGGSLQEFSQQLACGVPAIQGVASAAQGRGLASLWGPIAHACVEADVDVIADLGRLDRSTPTLPLAAASDRLLVVGTPSLESVLHTRETLMELAGAVGPDLSGVRLIPLIIGASRHAQADRADVDQVMAAAGVLAGASLHLPLDRPALARLEGGEAPTGWLAKTLLMRAAQGIVGEISQTRAMGVSS